MCECEATSDEHAPPRCFFPTGHRKQLLTVRSCDEHNSETSNDDEYVRNVLVTFEGCNELATSFLSDKTKRSFERSPKLLKRTFQNVIWTEFEGKKTAAFELDCKRVERTMHKIACALHFEHFNEKVTWNTCVLIRQLVGEDLKGAGTDSLFDMLDFQNLVWHGINTRVFKYRFLKSPGMPSTFHFTSIP